MYFYNLVLFQALPYLELEVYSKQCKTSPRYIQNPAIIRIVYSGIIHSYSSILRTFCYPCICCMLEILEYPETIRNCIQTHIQNPVILTIIAKPSVTLGIQNHCPLKILQYSEPWCISNTIHMLSPIKDFKWSILRT